MLYDKRWEQKTEPTLSGFLAWLEMQPARRRYRFMCFECAIGLYLRSIGTDYRAAVETHFELIQDWNWNITGLRPHTFGAAAKRARSALAKCS